MAFNIAWKYESKLLFPKRPKNDPFSLFFKKTVIWAKTYLGMLKVFIPNFYMKGK